MEKKTRHKRITAKYWDALEEGTRFRALRKACSNLPENVLLDYAMMKAKDMGFVFEIVKRQSFQTSPDSHYKIEVCGWSMM